MRHQIDDRLTCLLYTLIRDDVVPGRMEFLVRECEKAFTFQLSNPHIAAYARELKERLLAKP